MPRPSALAPACARRPPLPFLEALESRQLLSVVPAGFVETQIATGLVSPSAMAFAPDGRLFIAEQGGVVKVVKDGQLLPQPFVTVNEDSNGERGLLGIAFDPDFATNQFVYLYYTAATPASHNVVSRFVANGDVATGTETILFDLPDIGSAIWHMGGAINFGPDGKLYVAIGDYQVPEYSQRMDVPMGKILRINKDGTIPADNPFYNTTTGINRSIWALGLRNPFTTAFQPGTGRLFINDVGQGSFEEVNDGAAGRNYGWPATEGNFNQTSFPNFTQPFYTYGRSDGCAVMGGAFYNGVAAQFPAQYQGKYFFADFCNGWVRTIDPATKAIATFATGLSFPTGVTLAPDGSLWHMDRGQQTGGQPTTGKLFQVRYTVDQPPFVSGQPASQTVPVGEPVTFAVAAAGSPPLSYQWQRQRPGATGFEDIPGATAGEYTVGAVAPVDSGTRFRAVVTNPFGTATSADATLTVTSNTRPTPTIVTPDAAALYSGGQTIAYSGTAADAEDGDLPASAFTWWVDLHHDQHSHPFVSPTPGNKGGTFVVPTSGETSANVWYRINLTVTDAQGLTRSTFRDVRPRTANVTLASNVPGVRVNLDGQPQTTPVTFRGVAGIVRSLSAPVVQVVNGVTYEFDYWSDDGLPAHAINFPAADRTYTAYYRTSTATFLSDLNPVGTPLNGWGPYERDRSNGETGPADGRTITLNGVPYAKGLGVHSTSELVYNLGGQYLGFFSDIGVDDEVGANGQVTFQVWVDGVMAYDSGLMTGNAPTKKLALNVEGKQQLRLVVTDGGNGPGSDHADWADARLSADTGPVARVNFTHPTTGEAVDGYVPDTGLLFGDRGGGRTFGWNIDNTVSARDRDAGNSPDERYDSFNHMQKPENPNAVWEVAVPNGTYLVRVVSGDASNFDSNFQVNVEGVLTVSGQATTEARWVEGSARVTVTDGRLTVSNAAGASNNKVCFIDVDKVLRVPPGTPASLQVAASQPGQLGVGWAPVAGAEGYRIERSLDGSDFQLAGTVTTPGATSFTDSAGLLPATLYHYRVRAFNAGGTSRASVASAAYTFTAVPPTVAAVSINGGTAQRSTVRSVSVRFSADMRPYLGAAQLVLRNTTRRTNIDTAAAQLAYDPATNTATWTFPALFGRSLPDGRYTATLRSAEVADWTGHRLDGDANGSAGGDYSFTFHRLTGDADGDRDVDARDVMALRRAVGFRSPHPLYNPAFDVDGDGDVDLLDQTRVLKNRGKRLGGG